MDAKSPDSVGTKPDFSQKGDLREDSPAPMNFKEISRKPVTIERKTLNENKPFLRDRSASIGTINQKTPITQLIGEQNRTMLFQVKLFFKFMFISYFSVNWDWSASDCVEIDLKIFIFFDLFD